MTSFAKIKASRVNTLAFSNFIGEAGHLFFSTSTGELRISDGATVGGNPIVVNNTNARIGDLNILAANISTSNTNQDMYLVTNGTGNVNVIGDLVVKQTDGTRLFETLSNTINFFVPTQVALDSGIDIVGSSSGLVVSPQNTGVLLHITGQNANNSRIYNDGNGGYSAYIGRRYNGSSASPTAVNAGEVISRLGGTPYLSSGAWPALSTTRIDMVARENQTDTNQGSEIQFWAVANASASVSKVSTIDSSGLSVVGNVSANTYAVSSGGIRTVSGGTPTITLNFATDSIIHVYHPAGTVTFQYGTLVAGSSIRCLINFATHRNIVTGVSARDNINLGGDTNVGGAGNAANATDNTLAQLVYNCVDGTAANTYCTISYT